jgi:CRP/FNR family transcriptional regulator, cyclic AMP receptor protein
MAAVVSSPEPPEPVEDILAHIPCSRVLEYKTGDVIYGESEPVASIFLVIAGVVKVSRLSAAGQETIVDIYHTDDFLGLTAFLDKPCRAERATSLKTAQVMKWSIQEIKEIISRQPRLGIALLQMVIQRTVDFEHRVKSYSLDTIPCRLARSLLYLGERFGSPARDGSLLMTPFTHLVLSQYVGTSRAMVSKCMSGFRRSGYVTYSRRGISLDREALERWIEGGREAAPGGVAACD